MPAKQNLPIEQQNEYTVATVPDATKYKGAVIFVSNGAAGSACLAWSDGTNWIRSSTTSTAISAS